MTPTRVLINIGGVVGLSLALTAFAQPATPATPTTPSTPAKDQPSPTPAAPVVPAKDAPAAEPARTVSKEAGELLEKAKAAGKAANDLTADVESTMKNNGEGDTRKGKVVFVLKNGQMPFGNWRIESGAAEASGGSATATAAKVVAFDGTTLRTIDPSKKEMSETPTSAGRGFPSGDEGILMPMWFFEQRMPDMMAMMKPTVIEQVIEGEALSQKVGEEKVTVVRQVRTMNIPAEDADSKPRTLTETVRLSLGADNLPRKAERTIEVKGDGDAFKQEMVQVYANLKVNTTPGADVFTLKAPEGYATKQVAASEDGAPELKAKPGEPALDFNLKDAEGKEYKLADFKGKVVLLDFWATWCGPCKQAMPSIQKISETFKDKPVAVIGVNTWEKGEKAGPEYMKKQGYTYLNLLKGDDLAKAYGVSGIPTFILIDKDGKIIHAASGFGPGEEEELTKMITEKLK